MQKIGQINCCIDLLLIFIKSNKIYLCFKNDLTASQVAICGVNRNTINRCYNLPREAGSMSWTTVLRREMWARLARHLSSDCSIAVRKCS